VVFHDVRQGPLTDAHEFCFVVAKVVKQEWKTLDYTTDWAQLSEWQGFWQSPEGATSARPKTSFDGCSWPKADVIAAMFLAVPGRAPDAIAPLQARRTKSSYKSAGKRTALMCRCRLQTTDAATMFRGSTSAVRACNGLKG
jgi:hypothetical protein